MAKHNIDRLEYDSAETNETGVSIRESAEDFQVTVTDTGWSEEEKDRMKTFGYDGLDMVRAWYS